MVIFSFWNHNKASARRSDSFRSLKLSTKLLHCTVVWFTIFPSGRFTTATSAVNPPNEKPVNFTSMHWRLVRFTSFQSGGLTIAILVNPPIGKLVNCTTVHSSSSRSKMGDAKTFASCNFYDVLNAELLWHLIATDNDALTQWSEIVIPFENCMANSRSGFFTWFIVNIFKPAVE